MNRYVSLRLVTASVGVLVLVALTLLLRRPALAAVAAAVAAPVAIGLATWRRPEVDVELSVTSARAVEGDVVEVLVTVGSDAPVAWLDVEYEPGAGFASADGVLRKIITIPKGTARVVAFPVRPEQWGVLGAGRVRVVARDRFGLFALATIRTIDAAVRVYPAEARLRSLAVPTRTGSTLGAHLARVRGDGTEYADLRPWQAGDRRRAVNWRVTARRGATWVSERHPERATDVIVVLDDTAALGPADDTTLRQAVQAAMALTESHVVAQDRVGLLALGAPLRWLRPGSGTRQLYAIVDTLLDCREARMTGLRRGGSAVAGGIRPGTTILALTPLADERVVELLGELRRHGHDVVAIEPVVAAAGDPSGHAEHAARSSPQAQARDLAGRLWERERELRRDRLRATGVVLVRWDGLVPLGALLRRIGGAEARRPGAGAGRSGGGAR